MPRMLKSERQGAIWLIQIASLLAGKIVPTASEVLEVIKDSKSIELLLIPKHPEPGLDRVLIAQIELEDDQSCR